MIDGGKALAGCLLLSSGKQRDKGAGKLQLAAWSPRRSGIQGALPFRGGAGDNIEVRLAGTPAGRFAAITEPRFSSERLLVEAEGWHGLFAVFFAKSVTAGEL